MIPMEKVKKDLRELRYYFSRKKNMDVLFQSIGLTDLPELAQKYNNVIRTASARLFDLYGCLYIQNKTQEGVANELNYSPEYIRRLTKELFEFFQKNIKE
jgi:hypothetical protein